MSDGGRGSFSDMTFALIGVRSCRSRAANSPPPPCGEGSGVGVVEWSTAVPQPLDPPPRPSPTRGEGAMAWPKSDLAPRRSALSLGIAVSLVLLSVTAALPRSLQSIMERGTLTLCANPDALPWASKIDAVPGFQVELAENLAMRLGVSLTRQWVRSAFQYRRVDCDVVFDAIASKGASVEGGLRLSRPYQRSGVVLAARDDSNVASLAGLGAGQRVGVMIGSLASMALDKRGIGTTPFVFESEMMTALADRDIE